MSRWLKLFGREIIFEVFQLVWKTYVTDGQTDAQYGKPRLQGRNCYSHLTAYMQNVIITLKFYKSL